MNFEDAMSEAAKAADEAVHMVMAAYQTGHMTDEDDLTPAIVGALQHAFSRPIAGLNWSASVVRHRSGIAAEEKRIGADMVIHVTLKTPTQSYSKGALIQAKRLEPHEFLDRDGHDDLREQCDKMLTVTPAAFVFNYMKGSLRCGSATRIAGSSNRNLHAICSWTSYRFFWELFRCPVGDPRLTSALVSDLPVHEILYLKASGQLTD